MSPRLLPPLRRCVPALVLLLCVTLGLAQPAGQDASADAALDGFVGALEAALASGESARVDALLDPTLDPVTADSLRADLVTPEATRAAVRERDRGVLPGVPPGTGFRLIVEVLLELGDQARLGTFRLDLRRAARTDGATWRIVDAERLATVDGLFRLKLDAQPFAVSNLILKAEDFQLQLPQGVAFAAQTPFGTTALVLMGDGTMTFSPRPAAERVQVKLFSGEETMRAPFTSVMLRVNPSSYEDLAIEAAMTAQPRPDSRTLARAQAYFAQQVGKSFSLDLNDLSTDTWSLVPSVGDLLADVRTRKHGVLTYARSNGEPEDITLFDREARRNIAIYSSLRRMEVRGRSFNEDLLADYDITDYDVEAAYVPDREWMQGVASLRLRVRSYAISTLTLRLAETLAVQSVQTNLHGRVLAIRVRGQNSLVLSLPAAVARDEYLTLAVRYAGRLESLSPDREVVQAGAQSPFADVPTLTPEPRWVFSNRSFWYPQGASSDFATGRLRLSVPAGYDVAASGDPDAANPRVEPNGARTYQFHVGQPVRYFAMLISTLQPAGRTEVGLRAPTPAPSSSNGDTPGEPSQGPPPFARGVAYSAMDISVIANPRQVSRGRTLLPQVADILGFYGGVVEDFPYPSFTLALVDNELPGGHSPAYFALLNQPLPTTPFMWRNDPVYFDDYPQFFLAHELAHQFWGQAVGWKSYHEQWISEGFAQHFALLYAEHRGGPSVMRSVLSRMRESALTRVGQGPIWLGYRLGHVKSDGRVFRAIVYNKSALVLHMLRRLLGDEAYFRGLRAFYRESRFMKVGTEEVRAAFEAAAGRPLEAFFERWIYEFGIPTINYTGSQDDGALRLRFAQRGPEVYELPVTVTLRYADGTTEDVIVPLLEAVVERALPLKGPLRGWDVNADRAALAHFQGR